MNTTGSCPIWGTPAETKDEFDRPVTWVNSERAGGQYRITMEAECSVGSLSCEGKVKLTSWLEEERKRGKKCPEIRLAIVKGLMV